MKRKLYFLAILMCILGGLNISNLNAQTTVTIGSGDLTQSENDKFPLYTQYEYTASQQIYTKSELSQLPVGAVIKSIAFKVVEIGSNYSRDFDIYLKETEDQSFSSATDFKTMSNSDLVYSSTGIVFNTEGWCTFQLETPYTYKGGNILICVYDHSNNYSGSTNFSLNNTAGRNSGIFVFNQYNRIGDPVNGITPTTDGSWPGMIQGHNQIQLTFEGGAAQPQPQIIEIGAQTGSIGELPTNIYYNYSLTQQIYTKTEIGKSENGNITSIAFKDVSGYTTTRNIEIYMRNTTASSCTSSSEQMDIEERCWNGEVEFKANDWTTIKFQNPFEYEADKNIMLCVVDKTGSYSSGRKFAIYNTNDACYSFYAFNDQNPYTVNSNTYPYQSTPQKNCIKLEYEEAAPKPLSLLVSADKETIYTGETVQLTATASGGAGNYTYSWSPATGLNNTTSATPTFTPTTAGTYNITCEVTSATETATDNVTIVVEERPAAPSAPTNLQTTVNGTSVTLTWNAVSGATNYNVYTNNGTPIETTEPTYTITGLNPATTYCFTVTAVNIGGESSPSDEVCVKTDEIKRYRIKSVDYEGKYLNIAQITSSNTGGKSGVDVAAYAESDDQIFTIEDAGYGNVYFRSASGYYINCLNGWMVSAHGTTTSSAAFLKMVDKGNNTFAIQCNDGYFKVEEVSGGVYPFSNGSSSQAALWTLEEVGSSTPDIPNEGCEIIFTLIGETSNSWGSTSGLMVYYTGGPDDGDFLGLNDGSTSKTYTYNLPQGSKITVTLLTGNYPEEMGFTIAYANGVVLAQYNIGEITSNHNYTSPLWQKTVDCSLPVPNVIARAIGKSGIELTWDDINIANGYNVYDEDGNLIAENLTESSYVIKGLNATSEYCFTVTAVYEDDEESEHSELACATTLDSDVQEGVIGDGGESKEWIPIATYCKYSYSQQSYTKNEIANAGGAEGYISSVSYYVTSLGTTTNPRNLRVFLSNVDSQNEITFDRNTYQLISEDLVYEGPVTLTAGWVKINFQKPFKYNGNHIVITVIDDTGDTDYGDTYFSLHEKDENYKYWVVRGNSESKIDLTTSISGTNYAYRNDIKLSFVSEDVDIEFIGTGAWNDIDNWNVKFVPTADKDVIISGDAVITNDVTINSISMDGGSLTVEANNSLTINGNMTNDDASAFVIKDGAQVFQTNDNVLATFQMNINNPTEWSEWNKTGWQFIASPFTDAAVSQFTNAGDEYDLYKFDGRHENLTKEWRNHKDATANFETKFVSGRGYMASYESNTTATLSGTFYAGSSITYPVTYQDIQEGETHWPNFHLLGNPFTFNMDLSKLNMTNMATGVAVVNDEGGWDYLTSGSINVGDGFFVKSVAASPSVSYGTRGGNNDNASENINIRISNSTSRDNVVLNFAGADNAGFPKLNAMNEDIAYLYVVDNNERYGIFNYDKDVKEVPLSFEAQKMGNYTISVDAEGEYETIVLVDRQTGVETNMLLEDYKFTATTSKKENTDRFIVRFTFKSDVETESKIFAYQSGNELIIEDEGTVQLFDVTGRMLYIDEVESHGERINVGQLNKAAYILRLVNGEGVKVQKVIIY